MDIHASVARIAMLNNIIDIAGGAITEVKVGTTALIERKWLYIMNASNVDIFIGSMSELGTDITAVTLPKYGIKMPPGDVIWLPVNDKITVYAMAAAGAGKRLRIAELA